MTVSVGWITQGRIFKYDFSPDWLWDEFDSARKIAEAMIQTGTQGDDIIDIVIDYREVKSYLPELPKVNIEPPMGYSQEDEVDSQSRSKKKKGKQKKSTQGHDKKKPHNSGASPNIPDHLLQDHKWVVPVSCLTIVGCQPRMTRVIKDMMRPAYEWDRVEILTNSDTIDIDYSTK